MKNTTKAIHFESLQVIVRKTNYCGIEWEPGKKVEDENKSREMSKSRSLLFPWGVTLSTGKSSFTQALWSS